MLELAALAIGVAATVILALTVFIKDRQSITNRLFAGLAACIVGWTVVTYFSLHTSSDTQTLHWIRWIMFVVVAQNTVLFLLARVFPGYDAAPIKNTRYMLAIGYAALVAAAAASPFLFTSFENGAPRPGPAMPLFLLHVVVFALGSVIILARKYTAAQGLEKTQAGYFLTGTLLLVTVEPASNFIVPVVFGSSTLVAYSPIYSIIFTGLMAYAIITKRLFDIRAAITRVVGYALGLAVLAGVYALGLFGVIDVVFSGSGRETLRQALSVVLLVPLALLFQATKNFFDHITNDLFYQQSYDLREVLDKIGNVVSSDLDLDSILRGTRRVLQDALKASSIEFVLPHGTNLTNETGFGSAPVSETLAERLSAQHRELLAVETLDDQSSLRGPLREAGVAISLRLRTHKQVVGYLLLGEKKNGETYSPQDHRLLTLVADELAIAIQNAMQFEEIQQFNQTLQARINRATSELRGSNRRLKELDNTKDDFIGMASHQLRTPLTSVKGYLSMVLDGDAGELNDQQRKLLQQSYNSAQQMVYLISDLLNLSRLKTGKFVIEAAPVNLADIVQDQYDQLREIARTKHITFVYDRPEHFPLLMLDESKMQQAVMNLADNALHYTPDGGTVTLRLRETPEAVEYTVQDTGIGVPKREQHNLFGKMFRATNAQKHRPDGTGIGLFMVKKVAVAEGGSIIFESTEGKGSTFGFRLPKAKLRVPEQR